MAIDIRATVTCSLGTLISGSISDDYIQGTGLIKTKGSCVIDGLISPAVGTAVTFTYVKGGVTRRIPRGLVVISSFADPFRRTTTVQVGCKLTLQQNKREPILWSIFSDPLNSDVTEEELAIVTRPINASSVAAQCASRLGISGIPGLTNRFSIAAFDFSAGYVSILSDLMVSECKCGYMQSTSGLVSFSLSQTGGTGPVLDQSKIIDIAPIGVGELPGETVYVNYSTLKLQDPAPVTPEAIPNGTVEGTQQDLGGWGGGSGDTVTGAPTQITVTYKKADGTDVNRTYSYVPKSTTTQSYDAYDRVVYRRTVERTCAAECNASYIVAALEWADQNNASPPADGGGTVEIETVTRYSYFKTPSTLPTPALAIYTVNTVGDLPNPGMTGRVYKVSAECGKEYVWNGSSWEARQSSVRLQQTYGKKVLPDGYDQVASETTERREPILRVVGAIAPSYVDEQGDFITVPNGTTIGERTETTYKHGNRVVTKQNAFDPSQNDTLDIPITGTTTVTYRAYAYTPSGQQDIAARVANGQNLNDFLSSATSLAYVGVQRSHSSGREAALQARPSQADQVYNATAKKDDSGSTTGTDSGGYSTASESKIELITGGSGDSVVSLSMPYAPDDTFLRSGSCPNVTYSAIPSDASAKARAFGRAQNQLLHGNRYGLNVQTAPEYLPTAPFAPFYVKVGDITALYRTNGTSWTFDANGIVVSTDALFMGGTGSIGSSTGIWFPVAPGITTLPTTPGTTDTAPTQIIGNVATVGTNAQTTLNAAFPSAVNGDGVVDLATSDIWVKVSGTWVNRGPTPGVTLSTSTLVPVANERVTVEGRARASVQVTTIPYALNLPLVTLTPTVKAKARVTWPLLSGAFTATGNSADLLIDRVLTADSGSFALSGGGSTGVIYPRRLICEPASFTLTGGAALFPLSIVTGTAAPLLGAGGATSYTGWTRIQDASADDAYLEFSGWSFALTLASTAYSGVFISSNGYLTFGQGSTAYTNVGASVPALPKIHFSAGDRSYQRVYTFTGTGGDGLGLTRVRYEGASGTSGTPGSPTVVVEFTFFAPRSNGDQWIELRVGNHSLPGAPFMIANASTAYASSTIAANSSWLFVGNSTGTSWTLTSNRYIK